VAFEEAETVIRSRVVIIFALFLSLQNFAYAASTPEKAISQYSNEELIKIFEQCLTQTEEDFGTANEISDELVKRKAIKEVVELFEKDEGFISEGWCFGILEKLRGPETDNLLKGLATKEPTDRAHLANKYFAEVGEQFALENLNANYFQNGSSYEWSEIVELFGKYKYYPATENIISTINAASLNLAGASLEALITMYPETKNDVKKLEKNNPSIDGQMVDIMNYYNQYVKDHPRR
jgi:hypothetical protein